MDPSIPIIDVAALASGRGEVNGAADEIGRACRASGFFYVVGHGVNQRLIQRLEQMSREFFAQDLETKLAIRMELGGRAWRGYFPVGAELTSGRPDQKEGIYFGAELPDDHPKVKANTPMHGRNLFPAIPGFHETLLEYLDAMTALGHLLMEGIALSLELEASYFRDRYTDDPLILFRIFHYPPLSGTASVQRGASEPASQVRRRSPDLAEGELQESNAGDLPSDECAGSGDPRTTEAPKDPGTIESQWSVGEHTDYGILTILLQDDSGGLQVKSKSRWIDAPPVADSFVCNIGDMLDRMTGGLYRSTPHRVRNVSGKGRLSFPFFFDPNFDAEVKPIEGCAAMHDDKDDRWDRASVHDFSGTYGDYILNKVTKVFPQLRREAI